MRTVLVVDDEPAIVSLLRDLLEAGGYRILTAANGQDALDLLRAGQIVDLVVTDYKMPILDGGTLGHRIQHDPLYAAFRATPIILMSATARLADRGDVRFAALVQKPFPLEALLAAVARLIGPPDSAASP
jgi:CheY-like chemotaxis protein